MPNPSGNSGVIVSSDLTFITNEQGQAQLDRLLGDAVADNAREAGLGAEFRVQAPLTIPPMAAPSAVRRAMRPGPLVGWAVSLMTPQSIGRRR